MKILHLVVGGGENSWPFVWYSIKLLRDNNKYQTYSRSLHNSALLKIFFTLVYCKVNQVDFIVVHYGGFVSFVFTFFLRKRVIVYYRGTDRNFSLKNRRLRNYLYKKFDRFTSKNSYSIYTSPSIAHDESLIKSIILPSPINIDLLSGFSNHDVRPLFKENRFNIFFYGGNNRVNKGSEVVDILAMKFRGLINVIEVPSGMYSQPEVYNIMSKCDLVFHPSLREGSPNVVKEAIYLGVPTFSTYVGDLSSYESNVSCLVCCNNINEFVTAMHKFINDDFLFNFELDKSYLVERFGPDKFSASFYDFIETL